MLIFASSVLLDILMRRGTTTNLYALKTMANANAEAPVTITVAKAGLDQFPFLENWTLSNTEIKPVMQFKQPGLYRVSLKLRQGKSTLR